MFWGHRKAISITYSECVSVAFPPPLQCACAVLYCHLYPVRLYHIFPHYLVKWRFFLKKVTDRKMYVLIFSTTFVWNIFILRRIQRGIVTNVYWCSCKVPTIIVRLSWNFNFLDKFSGEKTLKYKILWKSVQWEPSCSMRTDGWTDRLDESNSHFYQFCESTERANLLD